MRCPKCNSEEMDAMTPRTVYGCGSSDYDQRPDTFVQSDKCKENEVDYDAYFLENFKQSVKKSLKQPK